MNMYDGTAQPIHSYEVGDIVIINMGEHQGKEATVVAIKPNQSNGRSRYTLGIPSEEGFVDKIIYCFENCFDKGPLHK